MKESSRRVLVPPDCLQIYTTAVGILRRKLGAKAPNAITLICLELSYRDPQMIADDYLETQARRPRRMAIRRRVTSVMDGGSLRSLSSRAIARGYSVPPDPARN
jgi:hypothetical protein